jgi:peptidoglycan lytic transglycosylase G
MTSTHSDVEVVDATRTRVRRRRVVLVLVVVIVLLGTLSVGAVVVLQRLTGGPADYSGSGTGTVVVEVAAGQTSSDIAATLERKGVIASAEVFVTAAVADDRSLGIQPGFYQLHEQMSGEQALALLLDPASRLQTSVTIPEGLRTDQAVRLLTKETDFTTADFTAVLENPKRLNLPQYARGNAEGFLFPATYTFDPDATAEQMLAAMVDRYGQAATDLDLPRAARSVSLTPRDAVIVASLVQAEVAERDFAKAARVVYNRLAAGMPLQFDSTVNFALSSDDLTLDNEQLAVDSPYNTYVNTGLPPGPINSPGEAALAAALNPADGDWLYFVAVAPGSDATRFTADYDEFLRFKEQFYNQVP